MAPGTCKGLTLRVHSGFKLKLIMPSNMTEERRAAMAAYGAELINVPAGQMEMARDMALEMQVTLSLSVSEVADSSPSLVEPSWPNKGFQVKGRKETMKGMHSWLQARGEGKVLDQFSNTDNPLAHYRGTGPELWNQTQGRITHFVSSMGTTG